MRLVFLVACVLLPYAPAAGAHPAPFSYVSLNVGGSQITGGLTLHVIDVAHDLGLAKPADLLDPAIAEANRLRIASLVQARFSVRGGSGSLPIEWGGIETAPERDAVRLSFRIAGGPGGSLSIRARLFPYDPLHQTFLSIYEDGNLRQQMVLDAATSEQTYYTDSAQGALAVAATFLPSGIHHILIGPDHILFLIGLLLLGGGTWALVRIVTAFTIGHSLTLSLAALGLVTPPATVVEPAIALSIVFVGADNLLVGRTGRDIRAWIALAFGLVHGFGFASVLRELGLPREALAWSLFSFNAGVEAGQLLIVLAVAGALAVVRRRSSVVAQRLAFAGSVLVMAAGAYWFVERVFFAGAA